jgi:uncharacterized protein Yka (UPF0111/DUF47 family)
MIKRSLLRAAIAELEEISKADEVRRSRYNQIYDLLRKRRFYLLPDDCERINTAIQEIERRCDEEDPMRTKIIRQLFNPDPAMNPSIYYESEDFAEGDNPAPI